MIGLMIVILLGLDGRLGGGRGSVGRVLQSDWSAPRLLDDVSDRSGPQRPVQRSPCRNEFRVAEFRA